MKVKIGNEYKTAQIVDGLLSVGIESIDYNEFIKRNWYVLFENKTEENIWVDFTFGKYDLNYSCSEKEIKPREVKVRKCKFSPEQKAKICSEYIPPTNTNKGYSMRQLMVDYKCSLTTINKIIIAGKELKCQV